MKAKNQKVNVGTFSTSNVWDICFPVQMLENQTDYIDSVKNSIFVYPKKTTKLVEVPENKQTELISGQISLNASNTANLPEIINDFESVEATELIEVVDYDLNSPVLVNTTSDRYKLIPNELIFPVIENILNLAGIKFTVKYHVTDYSMFYATYTIEDKRFNFEVAKGDIVKVVINVGHSYNSLRKYSIVISFMRLVCLNGLTVAAKDMDEYSLNIVGKHTENIIQSFKKLNESLERLQNADFIKAIANKYVLLNTVKVENLKTAIENTLKNASITAIETKNFNTVNNIAQRIYSELLKPELEFNGTLTNWHLYNGINAYIYDKDLSIATPEIRLKSDQKVFEYLTKTF